MDTIFNLKRANVSPDAPYMLTATKIGAPGQLDEITINLKKGELIGFAGLLGSGRTETAEMLFGAKHITTGEISIEGKPVNIAKPYDALMQGMAFCPEDRKLDGIIGDLSIRENIALAIQARRGFLHPLSAKEQNDLADKYIKALGIATPDAEKKIGELSGGNQQKVILARWMATEPKVLILDEPTRGIDIGAKAEIQRLMLEMCEDGVSVIFISSELDEIIRCSNRVIVMRDKEKVAELDGNTCTQSQILSIIAEGAASAGGIAQ
jgi:simple sugar transport system ATP-binding protein